MCAGLTGKCLSIARFQGKLVWAVPFAAALGLCLLTPVIFGTRYLDSYGSSFVLERFVSLVGVILLTPLCLPEQDAGIAELVLSKKTGHGLTLGVRLAGSLLGMALCVAAMVAALRLWHCEFDAATFWVGTLASAVALGAWGFAFHALTHQVVVGYLAALTYYMLNFTAGSRLGVLYLFSLSKGSMAEKYWLLGVGALLLAGSLIARGRNTL